MCSVRVLVILYVSLFEEEKKAVHDKFKIAKDRLTALTQQHANLIREVNISVMFVGY